MVFESWLKQNQIGSNIESEKAGKMTKGNGPENYGDIAIRMRYKQQTEPKTN